MADIVNASEIEVIKGSELPEVTSPEGMTFLGYDENSNPIESKRISFSNMTPLFGVANEEGPSVTLAGSQELVSKKTSRTEAFNVSQFNNKYDYIDKNAARSAVPTEFRALGQIITYKLVSGKWVTESYQGIDLTDWVNSANWLNQMDRLYSNHSQLFVASTVGSRNADGKLIIDTPSDAYPRIGLVTTPNDYTAGIFNKVYTDAMLKLVCNKEIVHSRMGGFFCNFYSTTPINDVSVRLRSDGKYEYTISHTGSIHSIFVQIDSQTNASLEVEVSEDSYIGDLSNVSESMTYTKIGYNTLKDDIQSSLINKAVLYTQDLAKAGVTLVDERTIKFKDTTDYCRFGIQFDRNVLGKGRLVFESDYAFDSTFFYEKNGIPTVLSPSYTQGGGSKGFFKIELPEQENISRYMVMITPTARTNEITLRISSDSYMQLQEGGVINPLNEIVVKAGGTIGTDCDFTDIKSALDSITNNNYYNRYRICVRNGIYDISNESYPFLGMKNYVDIVGDSKNGVTVINRKPAFDNNYAGFDPNYYGDKIKYALLKNMRIISYNGKGPVHIDTDYAQFAEGGVIEVENCTLINENTPEMAHYQAGLACGLTSGQTVIARNVDSNGTLWCHNNRPKYPDKGCGFELYNCRFPFTIFSDLYCYGRDKLVMHNCKCDYVKFTLSKHWNEPRDYIRFSWEHDFVGNQFEFITGALEPASSDGKSFWDVAFGGKFGITDSCIHMYCKNNSSETLPIGKIVTLTAPINEISIKPWEVGSTLYGVCLDNIPAGEYGIVQYRGTIKLAARTAITIGQALELDSDGYAKVHDNGVIIGYAMGNSYEGFVQMRMK